MVLWVLSVVLVILLVLVLAPKLMMLLAASVGVPVVVLMLSAIATTATFNLRNKPSRTCFKFNLECAFTIVARGPIMPTSFVSLFQGGE